MTQEFLNPDACGRLVSRRHAIQWIAAGAGGVAFSGPVGRALAQVPWGEARESIELAQARDPLRLGREARYGEDIRQSAPSLVWDAPRRTIWTTWTGGTDGIDRIWLRPMSAADQAWGEARPVSEEMPGGAAYESDVVLVDGRLVTVWAEYDGTAWRLRARAFNPDSGELGEIQTLAGSGAAGETHVRPAVAVLGDRAMVVWQAKPGLGAEQRIMARLVDPTCRPTGEAFAIAGAAGRDCCRPAIAPAPDGKTAAVAYDAQEAAGTQNVFLVRLDASGKPQGETIRVSSHPATDIAPSLAFAPDGRHVWVAWHTNASGEDGWDIPRWYRLRALRLDDATWHRPAADPVDMDLDKRGTIQSFELTRLAIAPSGAVCVLGRPSHNFYVQYYTGRECSPLYRVPRDDWGGRGKFLRGVFDDAGHLWVTRRDLRANVIGRIDGFEASFVAPALEPVEKPRPNQAPALTGVTSVHEWPEDSGEAYSGLTLHFGDIHGHSWQSDGMGEPEESFLRARDVFRDDFHALTDHDRFVGKRVMDAQWQHQKEIVEHFDDPGRFVTLFAQEWTTPRTGPRHGWGHYNIYSADPKLPLFDHGDPRYRDLPDLFAVLPKYNALAIPHHIGWTGVRWDVWDPAIVPAVEMCSVHGAFEYEGNEPIRHRGGMKGNFVRDGLARGLRFGIVGGCDQHGLIWHHGVCWKRNAYRAGLTGLWAPRLDREAVLEAIRERRTFATTGVKMCLRFAVNDRPMGSVIETDSAPRIQVDVAVPREEGRLGWIEIVRNGSVIHHYGGEGQRSRYTFVDEGFEQEAHSGEHRASWYYLRILLDNGNMAWSSPVWVTPRTA